MPSRTTSASSRASRASSSTKAPSKLRRVAATAAGPDPAFPDESMDVDSDATENDVDGPMTLDDPWPAYTFKPGERVWICHHDKWITGRIFPRSVPKIRANNNLVYYNVLYQDAYGHKLRRFFSPAVGELKPDTARIRRMLREARWIA